MNYAFGAARRLYERKQHPRIFLGPGDAPELRKKLAEGDGKKIMTAFRKQAHAAVQSILEVEPPEKLGEALRQSQTPGYGGIGPAMNMALVAVLDEDEEALEAVRRVLKFAPAAQQDPPPAPAQSRHRLGRCFGGPMSMAYDLVQPQLSTEERRAFCGWVYENCVKRTLADSLPNYYLAAGMNIPLGGLRNVVDTLMAIDGEDGVPDLCGEWGHALRMFEATLNTAIGPDGYPAEDMGYGTSVTGGLAWTAEALRRAGMFDAYKVCPQYARFGDAMLHLVQPWGLHLSTTGDHGDDFGSRVFVLARLAAETENPALLWLLLTLSYHNDTRLGKGKQAETSFYSLMVADQFRSAVHPAKLKKPPATQFRDRGRGIVTFRSGWLEDATFVVFDGSQRCPAAQGHEHASCGHFSISAFGEYFAIDTGRYNMEQNCHSVALIDGKSGRSTDGEWISVKHAGILTDFQPGNFADSASVDSSLQHNCLWARRHLGLVKGKHAPSYVWVVDDINKNNDWGEYWWQLHTCPENRIQLRKTHAVITGWRHGNKMDVHFALPAPTEYDPPHSLLGLTQDQVEPSSYKYVGPFKKERLEKFERPADQIHYSTFIRPRLIAKIAGLNGRFMSLMLPRRKTMKPATVQRLKSLPGSLAVRIAFDQVEDTLIFAYEHRILEAGDVRASGNWCVVRRNKATGKTLDYAVADGVMLAVGGKPLPV